MLIELKSDGNKQINNSTKLIATQIGLIGLFLPQVGLPTLLLEYTHTGNDLLPKANSGLKITS